MSPAPETNPNLSDKKLGIVAGSGQLPLHLAREAKALGYSVFGVFHRDETNLEFSALCKNSECVRVGQLGKIIKFFKKNDVNKIIFAGGISRTNLLKGDIWPDARGVKVLIKAGSVRDDIILRAIASEFEQEGISVSSVGDILKRFIPEPGVLTKRLLTENERVDSNIGWETAKVIGSVDVGQTVVVSQGMVVAVEAVEGTDATIKRGGVLSAGRGGVVVKTCKPQQDERLDLPTIGVESVKVIKNAGLTALIIEAGRSLVLEPEQVISVANELNIAIEAR